MKKRFLATVLALLMVIGLTPVTPMEAAACPKLNKTSLKLVVGESAKLKVIGKTYSVKFKSSNSAVANVNQKSGKVFAKRPGNAKIIANVKYDPTCAKDSKSTKTKSKKLTCKLTVTAAEENKLSKYWAPDSPTMKALNDYVAKVTNPDDPENFIPVDDRIAVFDMDGTMVCETYFTYYDTMMFIEYCLVDHPEKVSEELKQVARSLAPGYSATWQLAQNFAQAYAGMTPKELYDYAISFGQKPTVSFKGMNYGDGSYLPMVEVVKFLYENDFQIYVVSGTEVTTSRAIIAQSPYAEYIPPSQIIGTQFEVKIKGAETTVMDADYKYKAGDEMVFTGNLIQKNLNSGKPITIERQIGKKPVLAFGNSSSDSSMLAYTIDRNPYPSGAYMIVADDNVREWPNQSWEEKSAEYSAQGFHPVSTKNEFAQIYPKGIEKAENQVAVAAPAA